MIKDFSGVGNMTLPLYTRCSKCHSRIVSVRPLCPKCANDIKENNIALYECEICHRLCRERADIVASMREKGMRMLCRQHEFRHAVNKFYEGKK